MKLSEHIEHCKRMLEKFGDSEVILVPERHTPLAYSEAPRVVYFGGYGFEIRYAFKESGK